FPAFGALLLAAAAALGQDASLRLTPSPEALSEPAPSPILRLNPPLSEAPPAPLQTRAPAPPAPAPVPYGPQRISFPGGVTASFDLTYAQPRGYRPLTLDLYHPGPRPMALPLVVFVHGGGWKGGDKRQAAGFADFPRELAMLAAEGYVV